MKLNLCGLIQYKQYKANKYRCVWCKESPNKPGTPRKKWLYDVQKWCHVDIFSACIDRKLLEELWISSHQNKNSKLLESYRFCCAGVCSIDGLYYKDEMSFVVCSNGYASHQPCPPGTKTDKFPSYTSGYYYGSSDLCSVNLINAGFDPYSYAPRRVSYDKQPHGSYEVNK